jgi:cystathionine beta-lyase/cystathionine gamma-synthase
MAHAPLSSAGFGTRAIHVGAEPDTETGAVIEPISLSTTYKQEGVGLNKVTSTSDYLEASLISATAGIRVLAMRKS